MPLETGTYIEDLVPANPLGTDPKSQGDDHLRLLKSTIQNSFPDTSGAWSTTRAIEAGKATQGTHLVRQDQLGVSGGNFDGSSTAVLGGSGDFTVARTVGQGVGWFDITFTEAASGQWNHSCVASANSLISQNVNVTPVSSTVMRVITTNSGNPVDPISVSFTRQIFA